MFDLCFSESIKSVIHRALSFTHTPTLPPKSVDSFTVVFFSNRCVLSARLSDPLAFNIWLSVQHKRFLSPLPSSPYTKYIIHYFLFCFSADQQRWLHRFAPCPGLRSTRCNYFKQKAAHRVVSVCVCVCVCMCCARSPQCFFPFSFFLLSAGSSGHEMIREDNKLNLFISLIAPFCGGISSATAMIYGNNEQWLRQQVGCF